MPGGYSPLPVQHPGWYPPAGLQHPGFTTPTGGQGQHPTPSRTVPYNYQNHANPTAFYSGGGAPPSLSKNTSTTAGPQSAVKVSLPLMPGFTPHPLPPNVTPGKSVDRNVVATAMAQRVNPISGKSLERDLQLASKEELIQVLLDVCVCHASAASFVCSKAQLFSLRGAVPAVEQQPNTTTMTTVPNPVAAAVQENHTPTKVLVFDDTPVGTPEPAMSAHRTSAKQTPAKSFTPETRPFSDTLHPCLRLHGSCRHATSCIFRSLPQNVCLLWIRGSCAGGRDCGGVHRLPSNCPVQIQAVFDLSHGGDRAAMAQRAVIHRDDEPDSPEAIEALQEEEGDDGMSTPRAQMTVCANRREGRSGKEDVEEESEDLVKVARCLNDSFDLAVQEE